MRNFLSPLVAALGLMSQGAAEITSHDFSEPPDDLLWPAQIVDYDTLEPSEWDGDLGIRNYLNNTIFFDDNYLAMGVAPGIDGRAMWANPRSGFPLDDPDMSLNLYGFFAQDTEGNLLERVTQVSFDFAWASTDVFTNLGTLELEVTDSFSNTEYISIPLDTTFFHSLNGGGEGYAGHVAITPFGSLSNIFTIRFINLNQASPEGQVGEIGIDNLQIVHVDSNVLNEVYPVSGYNDTSNLIGYRTNALKGTGPFGFTEAVYNGGASPATFSVFWTPETPGIYATLEASGATVEPQEFYYEAFAWEVDTDTQPSGTYSGTYTVVNDGDSNDPDNPVHVEFRLYDPPSLTTNTSQVLTRNDQVSLSNAAAGGHAGARRASVEVTAIEIGNPRFSLSGIGVGSKLHAGEGLAGTVRFPGSAPAGTYNTQLRLKLKMTSPDEYLNHSAPVPDLVWNLTYTVGSANIASQNVTNGQDLANAGIEIGGAESGAALVGGTSGDDQEVELAFEQSPPQTLPTGTGSAVTVSFAVASPIYVLELSYGNLPPGYAEADLRVQAFSGGSWVPAISLNGNGGATVAGAKPFAGSYLSYLSTLGGGSLNAADLGAYGVDAAANTVWVVVDYSGLFQIAYGLAEPVALPVITAISCDPETKEVTISYQSVEGETFTIEGATELDDFNPIGTTEEGDGSVMEFIHQPEGAPANYYYRFSTP